MKFGDALRLRMVTQFQASRVNAEMEEELRSHIEHRADDLERSGLTRADAERRARIELGGRERIKQECHEAMGGNFLETVFQDVRLALRKLRKSPGFTSAAVLTLALAIGANAVVFSVMNAFIIRPLNVPHSESLYGLWRHPDDNMQESYPDYIDLRDRNHSFENLLAYGIDIVGLDTGEQPLRSWVQESSGNYFDGLGLQPYLGQFFHASDEHGPNSAPYIVLTYAFWHTHFHDDRGVIGRTVQLNKHPFTIIGVARPGFHGTLLFFNPDFFVPIVNQPQIEPFDGLNARGNRWVFMALGHLKPGVSEAQATADLNAISADLGKNYPQEESKTTFTLARPGLYGDYVGKPVREFLTGLMLLAGLILLGACANLGSLFAARAADRSREVALRLALGSSRHRILRGLFTEAVMIAIAGGGVGLIASVVLLRALSTWNPFPRWPVYLSVVPDATVYAVALLLALASGFLFGAVPVRQVLRTTPYEIVKAGSNARLGRRRTARDLLLVGQIAICALLVTSSMVAVRGLARSLHENFGFDFQHTMLAETDLKMAGYGGERAATMQKRMIEALQAIPGVESVALADTVPLGDGAPRVRIFAAGASDLTPAHAVTAALSYNVSPEYFRAAGTALLSGRDFTWHDDKEAPRVAIINPVFASKVFGSVHDALGSYFKTKEGTRVQVVGLVQNGKYADLTEDPQAVMFVPIRQSPSSATIVLVRSRRDPQLLAADMRGALRGLDASLPVLIETRYKQLDLMLFAPRMATMALGVLGAMGAMLAITGIFGMAAYSVSQRLRELGIRVALGGQRKEVLAAALGRAFKLLAFGSATGLLLGILATPVLAFIVNQATPRDPLVLSGVVLAMALLGLLATWIPARRALAVDPLALLREQ
jgi:predicted permease